MGGLMMGSFLWFASVTYSAVHLAAWNIGFPTNIERWMWRFASLYIGFSGILWLGINLLSQSSKRIWWHWYYSLVRRERGVLNILIGVLCGIYGFIYVVARSFVVVEAFISLRSLPKAAYYSPQWTVSVPHL